MATSMDPAAGSQVHPRDTTVMKVDSRFSPHGNLPGEKYLAMGKHIGMRMFELAPGAHDQPHARPYETVGYVLKGQCDLEVNGQHLILKEGDSWHIPAGSKHCYNIKQGPFQCIEATNPPSVIHDRDRDNVHMQQAHRA